MQNISSVIYP